MFDNIFNNSKTNRNRELPNDFTNYHSNSWNKQASNVAQSLVRSLRGLKIGRFRYDSVNVDDPSSPCYNSNWIQMLPRVYDASPNGRGGCWSPVELSASRNGSIDRETTVLDRFMRIVQIDRSLPIEISEIRMERFYVNNKIITYQSSLSEKKTNVIFINTQYFHKIFFLIFKLIKYFDIVETK